MRRFFRRIPEPLLWIGAVVVTTVIVGGLVLTRTPEPPKTTASDRSAPDVIGLDDDERISARTTQPLKVTFMGTSLGAGYYASTEAKSYVGRLTTTLEKPGPVVASRAPREVEAPGTPTTTDTFDPSKVAPDQDLYVIEVGTNDSASKKEPVFERDYRRLLDGLAKRSPGAMFLCAGVWQEQAWGYDAIIQSACRQHGGRFVALTALFGNDDNHGPEGRPTAYGPGDLFHPNDAGHKAIARAMLDSLADYTAPVGEPY